MVEEAVEEPHSTQGQGPVDLADLEVEGLEGRLIQQGLVVTV